MCPSSKGSRIGFRRSIEPETVVDELTRFCYDADVDDDPDKSYFTLLFGGSVCYEADRDAFETIIDGWAQHIRSGFIHFKSDNEVFRYYFNATQQRWIDQKGRPHYAGNRMIVEDWEDKEETGEY